MTTLPPCEKCGRPHEYYNIKRHGSLFTNTHLTYYTHPALGEQRYPSREAVKQALCA